MRAIALHDREIIAATLRRNTFLHLYELGDLDDFFWPYTQWYGLEGSHGIEAIALLYTSSDLPVLLLLDEPPVNAARELLSRILPFLPRRIYCHLSAGLAEILAADYLVEADGWYLKMALTNPAQLESIDSTGVVRLGPADEAELLAFYTESYPGNWFDPRMLETGQFFGCREQGQLRSVAGIHVYSPSYQAAALGNITTHPAARGRGLATRTSAALCRSLRETVQQIGLNVRAENASALACYRRLGFEVIGEYGEYMLEQR